jgi:hypothetical protein
VITRLYTWEVPVPDGAPATETLDKVAVAADRVATYNPECDGVEVALTEGGKLRITVTFTGRDQWWIKKRIVYAIGLERPPDARSTRQRASDGRHNPIPDDQDIDHADMGLETV